MVNIQGDHHLMSDVRWGTPEDRVLVVGAHWDTVPGSGGLDDNGSGEESNTDTWITLCVIRSGGAAGAGQGPAPG